LAVSGPPTPVGRARDQRVRATDQLVEGEAAVGVGGGRAPRVGRHDHRRAGDRLLARVEHQPLEPEGADRVVVDEDGRLADVAPSWAAVAGRTARTGPDAAGGRGRRWLGLGRTAGIAQDEEPDGDEPGDSEGEGGQEAGFHRCAL
jgi:hypothetical protein